MDFGGRKIIFQILYYLLVILGIFSPLIIGFGYYLVLETPISEFFHSQQRSTQPSSEDINTENDSMTKCQVCVKS